ncbi:MAG: glycosyltransferase family 4 protein [Actinobacteria bacterium]|nr:glycosyltransferase family 4 protein [Actinomycetota bacterium]
MKGTAEPLRIGLAGPLTLYRLRSRLEDRPQLGAGLESRVLTDLVEELHRRGHELVCVSLSPDPDDWGSYRGDRLHLEVGPYRRRHRWIDGFRVERQWSVERLHRADVDIVHAHWTYEFALAALASDHPTLVTVHDWAPEILRHHRHPYRLVRLGMQRKVLRRAPHLIANSPYIAERVFESTGRSVPVIPNGRVMRDTCPPLPQHDLPRLGALNSGFGPLKNVTTLLRAFQIVRRSHPGVLLRLAGTDHGPDGAAAAWATSRGLTAGVEFVGRIESGQVAEFMRSLDVFVHPSLEESFGMVLIEAIDEGIPVVGGHQSGAVPWVLDDGRAGVLADVESPERLASSVVDLLDDRERRSDLSRAAFERTRSRFSLDQVAVRQEAEYRRVLAASGGRSARRSGPDVWNVLDE